MSNDRFSQCLRDFCGEYLGKSFETIIINAYPQLKSDASLRDRYTEYLEKQDTIDAYNSICALSKIAKATKDLSDSNIPETQRNPELVLDRLLPAVQTMAKISLNILDENQNPLVNNILLDNYSYMFAQTLYLNEFNHSNYTRIKKTTSNAVARQIASCIPSKDVPKFVKIIEDSSDISAKSMMLIGNLHPKFRELAAIQDPEVARFCQLAATFPRATFVACAEMKFDNEPIKDFDSFRMKVASDEVIKKSQSLTQNRADMIFKTLDMTKPVTPSSQPSTTPQHISGGRE